MAERIEIATIERGDATDLSAYPVVVVGYAGRHEDEVRRHIEELEAVGVAPPSEVPMFYPMPEGLLTTSDVIDVDGEFTSGEVEPVYLQVPGGVLLGLGSDHTDRRRERDDVATSKAVCPKPVGPVFLRLASWDDLDWDACRVRSWVDGVPYQDSSLAGLRHPSDVLGRIRDRGVGGSVLAFGGTVPVLSGELVYGRLWELRLDVPGMGSVSHSYTVRKKGEA